MNDASYPEDFSDVLEAAKRHAGVAEAPAPAPLEASEDSGDGLDADTPPPPPPADGPYDIFAQPPPPPPEGELPDGVDDDDVD